MANTKSAKKQVRKISNKTSINKYWKNSIKMSIRSYNSALASKDDKEINKTINKVKSVLDKASQKNVIHKNKASRIKSKLEVKSINI